MNALLPYLGALDALTHEAHDGNDAYVQPALRNLGAIAIPVLREVIAPAAFRNADPEITDIAVDGVRRVRAVANKFKFGERARGLQVLRLFGAGGRSPQNRTAFPARGKASDGFDLNTLVFGDSAEKGGNVLPVKAGVSYSDAISLASYEDCVDATFHNRAAEDGSLFNPQEKRNSVNLFDRHFVRPGTLLLQVLTLNGRTAPPEALDHLLLAIGLAGAYGGQTSIYGVNVRNRILGVYAGRMERAVASPYVALNQAAAGAAPGWQDNADQAAEALDRVFAAAYPIRIDATEVAARQSARIQAVEAGDPALAEEYGQTARQVAAFFDAWFEKH